MCNTDLKLIWLLVVSHLESESDISFGTAFVFSAVVYSLQNFCVCN